MERRGSRPSMPSTATLVHVGLAALGTQHPSTRGGRDPVAWAFLVIPGAGESLILGIQRTNKTPVSYSTCHDLGVLWALEVFAVALSGFCFTILLFGGEVQAQKVGVSVTEVAFGGGGARTRDC